MKRGAKMWLLIGGAIVLGAIVMFVVVPALVHKTIGPKLEERIAKRYPADKIILKDLKALSFGLTSKGVTQSRGNGGLVLTADALHWFQFTPDFEVSVRLTDITKVDKVRSHLGKSIGHDVLYVEFATDGKTDSIAWNVMDLPAWLGELSKSAPRRVIQ